MRDDIQAKVLELWKKGDLTGHQYETPDGGQLDILTISNKLEYVVLEFKRDKKRAEGSVWGSRIEPRF